jgi:predicted transcriptional regulator
MKTIIANFILAIMLMMTSINAQAQKNPFDKFSDYEDVTYIFISEAMLKLVGTTAIPSIDGIDINEIGSKLKSIQIITSEKCTKNSLKSEAMSIIKKESYEKLIQVSEKDNKVDIYFKDGKKNSIIVMVNDEKDDTVLIVFSGEFGMANIAKMLEGRKK